MGYYVRTTNQNFTLPKENFEAAYKAACELNWRNDLKNGKWGLGDTPKPLPEGPTESCYFSWVAWNYHEICKDLPEVLETFGFEVSLYHGHIDSLCFDDKRGDELHLLRALAPFVREGSTLDWVGEDDTHFRCLFKSGEMKVLTGSITWEDPD
ncbi:MAG: hypothetical protein ACK443_12550 [Methylococcaceae bacterium]|jgi:hypothetical protein